MITIRPAAQRGHFNHGWLDTYHTFSFGDYWDPRNMSFGPLRVINEDRVAPAMGFPTHPHRDMEILTYVLEGELSHKDSMGNGSTMRPGEVQRMSAGTGVRHSEFNSSETDPLHLLQIWIIPDGDGFPPSYEQKEFPTAEKLNQLRLVASRTFGSSRAWTGSTAPSRGGYGHSSAALAVSASWPPRIFASSTSSGLRTRRVARSGGPAWRSGRQTVPNWNPCSMA